MIEASGESKAELKTLIQSSNPHAIIETIKPANDGRGYILRLFESIGSQTSTRLQVTDNVESIEVTDIFENDSAPLEVTNNSVDINLNPFEIIVLRVIPEPSRA